MNQIKKPHRLVRRLAFSLATALLVGVVFFGTRNAEANHPVLVEGNCDSPVPGTTIVTAGTCGDFDGDGRIGTAEDTDGADRIFGTLNAALGPGTGAAAGTGANQNGTITIVTSGRFAETLSITPGTGIHNHGNVTIQAAPGVEAQIDAVLQGDPAGLNNSRQAAIGITVFGSNASTVILRNLTIRNFTEGIQAQGSSRVTIDNCRVENNVNYGVRAIGNSRVGVFNSKVNATGYRQGTLNGLCPGGGCVPTPGHAISFENTAGGTVVQTILSNNYNRAISNTGTGAVTYRGAFIHNNTPPDIVGATRVDF